MNTIFGMVLIVFMLVLVLPDPARSAGSSASDTNRNTVAELAVPPGKEEIILRTYQVLLRVAAIFSGDETGTNVPPAVQRENVKKFFLESGVLFPEGTSLIYKPSLNLLIVSNTADNLARIERILSALNKSPAYIEVEVRFVEIEQEVLGNLNAEWMIDSGPTHMSNRQKTDKTGSNTPAVHVSPAGGGAGALGISSVLTNPQMSLILHALEQGAGANLLSAPGVTTQSGENAEIKVVREIRYPTEYETQTVVLDKKTGLISLLSSNETALASNLVMTAVGIPKFETREIGVILNVTPTVDPDGRTIYLTLNPQVVELVEWINYGYSVRCTDGSTQQVKMLQPVFHTRSLATQISIQDGQTIVMGGLVTEIVDKDNSGQSWFSRNFGSKSKPKIRKINAMIFVTARIVDAAGNPIGRPSQTSD